VVIDLAEITDPEALTETIRKLAREQHILRVKGYVAVIGKPMRMLVQAVGQRVRSQFDRPWAAAPRVSRLVVIAERHHIDPAAIRATLTRATLAPSPTHSTLTQSTLTQSSIGA
jgi:cobalamin biosynthesis protein CobW